MRHFSLIIPAVVTTALLLAGCASDGNGVLPTTTASIPQQTKPAAAKQPSAQTTACMALRDRIVALRSDGTVGRVEKAATGKTKVVRIKREALTKVAELNAANAEYRNKCSIIPVQAAKPAIPPATAAKAARAAGSTAAPKKTAAAVAKKATAKQ